MCVCVAVRRRAVVGVGPCSGSISALLPGDHRLSRCRAHHVACQVATVDDQLGCLYRREGHLIRAFDYLESAYIAWRLVEGGDSAEARAALAKVDAVLDELGLQPYVHTAPSAPHTTDSQTPMADTRVLMAWV